jgi:hypothetical protein
VGHFEIDVWIRAVCGQSRSTYILCRCSVIQSASVFADIFRASC